MKSFSSLLTQALAENNLSLADTVEQKLLRYLELLQTWNKVFNLTAITDAREMVYLHIIDSLLVLPYLHGQRHLDVGSGAGLPGIPLALVQPDHEWIVLDKNSKKTRFMTQSIAELQLKNVKAEHSNVEKFHPAHNFDSIVSRAFGTIRMFIETTAPLLNPNGQWMAMKGKYPHDEIADLPKGFEVNNVVKLTMHGMQLERHLVLIKRTS